jgi:hypothetical protein
LDLSDKKDATNPNEIEYQRQLSEKEKMAAALFGGVGSGGKSNPSRSRKSSAATPPTPAPVTPVPTPNVVNAAATSTV